MKTYDSDPEDGGVMGVLHRRPNFVDTRQKTLIQARVLKFEHSSLALSILK